MRDRTKLIILACSLLFVMLLFIGYDLKGNLEYIISRRFIRLATMLLVGTSVGISAIIFQTITGNRILTPSIMGYESIFILFQTLIVFSFGDQALQTISQEMNFFLAVVLMLLFSLMMYLLVFHNQRRDMFQLLLIGMVMGALFQSLSQFMHILIDPNEFSVIQNFMFVSFSKMNTKLLGIAAATLLIALIYLWRLMPYLDVLKLGRDQAINLGIHYNRLIKQLLLLISLMVSVSTALVGPITFLGILVSNITYELLKSYRHRWMLIFCAMSSCIFLVMGQFLIEHVLKFSTTVSIVINFIGAIYFMFLLWKARKIIR
ncbi:MAG: iron chelate uptake ABC transporter family permease subunit [Sphingobacterium sp.]|jgi:iron complex transport system permease protein|nr:iron chelate uptake ABC transporter family permease subunit [Sphingobacterium sp.]